jgi:hypothetical protein
MSAMLVLAAIPGYFAVVAILAAYGSVEVVFADDDEQQELKHVKAHIGNCVEEGVCPRADSRLHRLMETLAHAAFKRNHLLTDLVGAWVMLFISFSVYPLTLVTKKRYV